MKKLKDVVVGADISKAYFDLYFKDPSGKEKKAKLSNDKKGFQKLTKMIPSGAWVVMEASGPYYYQLACYLFKKEIKVSVLNPLVIRRFMQMQLKRVKTDSADAKGIAAYGELMKLKQWDPLKENYLKLRQWHTIRKQLLKHLHATTMQLNSFLATGKLDNQKFVKWEWPRSGSACIWQQDQQGYTIPAVKSYLSD